MDMGVMPLMVNYDLNSKGLMDWEVENIFNNSKDIMCIIGYDYYFKKINPAFTKILGYSENELLNRSCLDFVYPDDINKTTPATLEDLSKSIEKNLPVNRVQGKDGMYRWLEWTFILNEKKQLWFVIARDITREREAFQEIEKLPQ